MNLEDMKDERNKQERTSEARGTQQSLRDGYASLESEKSLEKVDSED